MLPSFARETVTVLRPEWAADHGALVPDWDDVDETDLAGCSLQPAAGGEDTDHRDTSDRLGDLFAPGAPDIRATDRIQHGDTVYEVVGVPEVWPASGTALGHVHAKIRRWEG
jgi:hypothetical protein